MIKVTLKLGATVIVKASTALKAVNLLVITVVCKDLERLAVEAHRKVRERLRGVAVELRQRRAFGLDDESVELKLTMQINLFSWIKYTVR